ncbi:MAG TPA: hypothetical protein VFQ53_33020 [Kofleriaceae bacterium]|nr:hypothetical protein [Kofleriaceae bacterium]
MIQSPPTRVALAISLALHVALAVVVYLVFDPREHRNPELVDIEIAPPPPPVEALPAEVAKPPEQDLAGKTEDPSAASTPTSPEPGDVIADAGVDAPIDAAPDAPADARPRRPDAAPDASEPLVAEADAGADGGAIAQLADAAAPDDAGIGDATQVASNEGSAAGSGDGSGSAAGPGGTSVGSGALATEAGSGSGVPGMTNEPAVEGAPTTAGTAANLLAYFPAGHQVTALIRFDRLRGTEWAAQTERLLRPMPDYRVLFGPREAKIYDKLEMLVISTPRPRDATATTLVARSRLSRSALRDFLGATTQVAWSTAKGGMLGTRTGKVFPGDKRVFLSPFKGWFLLAQPGDLGGLVAAAPGSVDAIEATGKLPAWLAGIRKIESETGDPRGPALVVTIGLGGQRIELGDNDFGLGVKAVQTPDRISLAMELVKQGWLVRGNMRFPSEAAATEFITAAETAKQRVADSRVLQAAIGKPVARVIANLSFARTGARVSYSTSISIADTRAILAVAAQTLDSYYGAPPP